MNTRDYIALAGRNGDIVAFYHCRYVLDAERFMGEPDFLAELKRAINDVWYELGLYAKRGCDAYGRTYVLVDSAADDAATEARWQVARGVRVSEGERLAMR